MVKVGRVGRMGKVGGMYRMNNNEQDDEAGLWSGKHCTKRLPQASLFRYFNRLHASRKACNTDFHPPIALFRKVCSDAGSTPAKTLDFE